MNKNIVIPTLMVLFGFGGDFVSFFILWQDGSTVYDWYFELWALGGVVALIGAVWLIISLLQIKT